VILAKTVKGFGMGKAGEGQMVTHQQKKLDDEDAGLPRSLQHPDLRRGDLEPAVPEACRRQRRRCATCAIAARRSAATCRSAPRQCRAAGRFRNARGLPGLLDGTGDREISTTMAFVRILTALLKDKNIGRNIVPIVPDEARTFGMEGLFRQVGIYSSVGQLYTPQDADQLMSYREDKKGQILEEGINEAGAMCSWIAAGTAYANHGINMVPFYIYYSMFGFQRVGDFIWAAGDMQHARLPDGRDRRAHHARGRGPAAPGRPQPAARDDGAELPCLRPDLCLRARRHHPGRHAPHVREGENVFYYVT
jgi:pyruvate dehydrogenase E1 component